MKVRFLQELNTPHRFIPAGAETELDDKEAAEWIAAGIAEAVKVKRERAVKKTAEKAVEE